MQHNSRRGDVEVYTIEEVARASHVPVGHVRDLIRAGQAIESRGFIGQDDAVHLVRLLSGRGKADRVARAPVRLASPPRRRSVPSLLASGLLHAGLVALLLLITSLGLLNARDTEQVVKDDTPIRLVYLMSPGPGGGGGGGGLKAPTPAPKIERKPPKPKPRPTPSPVPPRVRRPPPRRPKPLPPPPPVEQPRIEPLVVPTTPEPVVQAPVQALPADPVERPGVLDGAATAPSNGPGTGGGTGTGSGTGMGEGNGAGIGPGSGGGTGGGPFRPGSGIEPPTLIREVRPQYTEDARKRALEGNVVLEIVVRRDGTVGDIKVVRNLGAGLDQKAVDAVRQWRFGPARRQGSPVDVVVEVSVEFKLR